MNAADAECCTQLFIPALHGRLSILLYRVVVPWCYPLASNFDATRRVQACECRHQPAVERRPCVIDVVVLWRCSGTTCALPKPDQLARPRSAQQTQISLLNPDQLARSRSACQSQISLPDTDQLAKPRSACKSIGTGGLQPADCATAYKPPQKGVLKAKTKSL